MLSSGQYASTPVYDLLDAAARGKIGFDHRLIQSILDRGEEAVPDLLRYGLEDQEDAPLDLEEDILALFRALKRPEAVPFYMAVVRRNPESTPDELIPAILDVREEALEALLELYADLEEGEAGDVAFLLAALRLHDDRVLKILLDRLEYDAGDGALMLGLYGDAAAAPALEKMLADIPGDDHHLRAEIQSSLEQLGRPVEIERESYDIYQDYPEVASPQFEYLSETDRLEMLRSDSPEIRAAAAESFFNRELNDSTRQALFEVAKSDPDPRVRGAAWETLHDELEAHPQMRKEMIARLADPNVPVEERAGALVGLSSMATKREVRPFLDDLYADPVSRAKALEAMWRSLDRVFIEFPPKHLDDPDPVIRRQAIWGVGYLTITSAAEQLIPFFEQDEFRADALYAYAMSTRHETSKAYIKKLLRRIEELAGGLTEDEEELVKLALDERLMLHGHDPVFFQEH